LRSIVLTGTPPIVRRIVAIRRSDIGPLGRVPAAFYEVLDEVEDVLAAQD
jgi:hypothetical protein